MTRAAGHPAAPPAPRGRSNAPRRVPTPLAGAAGRLLPWSGPQVGTHVAAATLLLAASWWLASGASTPVLALLTGAALWASACADGPGPAAVLGLLLLARLTLWPVPAEPGAWAVLAAQAALLVACHGLLSLCAAWPAATHPHRAVLLGWAGRILSAATCAAALVGAASLLPVVDAPGLVVVAVLAPVAIALAAALATRR